MTIGIVGLGLIGGSLAKTIKLHTSNTVLGHDVQEKEFLKAELVGAIDGRLSPEKLATCDVVLLALYPRAIIQYVLENADHFRAGALVVDCGGVKRAVCDQVRAVAIGREWTFIGGHPMAGREYSGFSYAKDDLFENASMILTPYPDTPIETLSFAKEFFLTMGFRRVVFATPQEHDEMIAYTSQMAHIISSAYVKSELALKHRGFSAGSFMDMTRVARLNETMWSELFALNREALLRELDGIIARLGAYKDALSANDEETMAALLRDGRERKEMLAE
jgi:prephenate dehydrogenase